MTTLHYYSATNISQHGTSTLLWILLLLLLCSPAQAQPSPPGSDTGDLSNQSFSPSMGVIIIVLIAALFFMGLFSMYIRHCSQDTTTAGGGTTRRRILGGSIALSRRPPRGLDPAVIESFPTFDYAAVKDAQIGKGALECAVCLTEFEDDDTLRLIPKCDHVFHPDCIDQWLAGHTTCPVCRANLTEPVELDISTGSATQNETLVEMGNDQNSNSNSNSNSNGNNVEQEDESMEQPLHGRMRRSRSMIRNISMGRPRWKGKFTRSSTTGHVEVKQWESMQRFTLRVPEEVRTQIMSGKLQRSTSLVVLPRRNSSRRVHGEESSKDRWAFSLAPPFFTRVPSIKSPKFSADTTVSLPDPVTDNSTAQVKSIRLPV